MDESPELGEIPLDAYRFGDTINGRLSSDHHVAVFARVPCVLISGWGPNPVPGLDAFVETVPADVEIQGVHLRLRAGHLDQLPPPADFLPVVKGRQNVSPAACSPALIGKPDPRTGWIATLASWQLILKPVL